MKNNINPKEIINSKIGHKLMGSKLVTATAPIRKISDKSLVTASFAATSAGIASVNLSNISDDVILPELNEPLKEITLNDVLVVEPVTDEQVDKILIGFNLSKSEIQSLRIKIKNLNIVVNAIDTIIKYNPEVLDFAGKPPKEIIKNIEYFSKNDEVKYINSTNVEFIKEKYNLKDEKSPFLTLTNLLDAQVTIENFNKILTVVHAVNLLTGIPYDELMKSVYIADDEGLDSITQAKIIAQHRIDKILGKSSFSVNLCSQIKDPSKITALFLAEFMRYLAKAKELGIEVNYFGDVTEYADKLKNIVDKCEGAGLNFNFGELKISQRSLDNVLQEEDLSVVKSFLDKFSDESKKMYSDSIYHILDKRVYSDEDADVYPEIYNLLSQYSGKDILYEIGNPAGLIESLKQKGVTDFGNIFKLLTAFFEVGILPTTFNMGINSFIIKDNDYESAISYINGIGSLKKYYPEISELIELDSLWNMDRDFKLLSDRVDKVKSIFPQKYENHIRFNWLVQSDNPECVEIVDILNKCGVRFSSDIADFVVKPVNLTAERLRKVFHSIVEEVRNSVDGLESVDDDFLLRILFSSSYKFKSIVLYMINNNITSLNEINGSKNKFSISDDIAKIIKDFFKPELKDFLTDLIKNREEYGLSDDMFFITLKTINKANMKFANKIFKDNKFPRSSIYNVLAHTNEVSLPLAEKLYSTENFDKKEIATILSFAKEWNLDVLELLALREDINSDLRCKIMMSLDTLNLDVARDIFKNKNFDKAHIDSVLDRVTALKCSKIAFLLLNDLKCSSKDIYTILTFSTEKNLLGKQRILENPNLSNELKIMTVKLAMSDDLTEYAEKLVDFYKGNEISIKFLPFLMKNYGKIDMNDLNILIDKVGIEAVLKLNEDDLLTSCQLSYLYKCDDIDNISVSDKKKFMRFLVSSNDELFRLNYKLSEMFPLLPQTCDEYCSILPVLASTIGIEIEKMSSVEVEEFNVALKNLALSLSVISDTAFNDISVTQEFSREDFIKTVWEKVKLLPLSERQKVYDYYGFELKENIKNPTGFTIFGYPTKINLNKGIESGMSSETLAVIKSLRNCVLKFVNDNRIYSNNSDVEKFLNIIVKYLPEIRTQIGKVQHGIHDFDIMKHSLKVMQKIVLDPNFNKLNNSDKKLMLLAALMHDITKLEGYSDPLHPKEGSFDVYYIAKKFNLSPKEQIKLYNLIKNHDWLAYVSKARSEFELKERLKSVAYDLRYDNIFDMLLIFTHADLKSVKNDGSLHEMTSNANISLLNNVMNVSDRVGKKFSFGESADLYAAKIKHDIAVLQVSQPLLPVTDFPSADTVSKAVKHINSDGSTDLKGVYIDKNGLVVIKFNEVEDWQKIGFPKGAVSSGISAPHLDSDGKQTIADTGNIKFFVHGLDYPNQLIKFDAISLINSEALLSVSYAERPESKYRFFRPQGVILHADTFNVHGGGENDSGSGYAKYLSNFKRDYIFGGYRESDRVYVSNLIKQATGMSDEEYVEFVRLNENKQMHEIEPAEYQDAIIKALASINSNVRKGNRKYNEMFITCPRVMGVFAYSDSDSIGNLLLYINSNKNLEFLKEYALKRNLPFVVFGD